MKHLNQLLEKVTHRNKCPDVVVENIVLDSRQVKSGDCFIAYPGFKVDGRDYIDQAIAAGASVVLYEAQDYPELNKKAVPCVAIDNLAEQVSLIAGNYYDHPSQKLDCIAITGTNGKTSISQFMAQAFTYLGKKTAIMGTMGVGFLGDLKQTNLTTADAITVQHYLAKFVEQGVEVVTLEASSHALDQNRLQAIELNSAHFTNLTHEHLDYHETMDAYGEAKARLFAQSFLDRAVFNVDDDFGQVLYQRFKKSVKSFCYGIANQKADFHVSRKHLHPNGITAEIKTPDGYFEIEIGLLGEFNLANILAVIVELYQRGYSRTEIEKAVKTIVPIDGRMQILKEAGQPSVIVDYAHTPDALENALHAVRAHSTGQVWCVFGCGGNRDAAKRKLMGQIADRLSDQVVLCDDNPRHERSEDIIEDILKGITNLEHVYVQPKRDQAIEYAIAHANENDIILIAGKGHEDYQIYGDTRLSFSDVDFVKALLKKE